MVDTIPKTVKLSYMGSSQMCLKNPSKITKNKTVAIHPRDHIKFYKNSTEKNSDGGKQHQSSEKSQL